MSQQTYANPAKLYTQTLPLTNVANTSTGMANLAFTYQYIVDGNRITLLFPQTLANATGISTTITWGTALPVSIRPIRSYQLPVVIQLNGIPVIAIVIITTAGNVGILAPAASIVGQQIGYVETSVNYTLY
jgi:hypothetical protein